MATENNKQIASAKKPRNDDPSQSSSSSPSLRGGTTKQSVNSKHKSSKQSQTLKPKLRFKQFEGEWNEKTLKDITKINQGLQIAIAERYTQEAEDLHFYITNEFLRKGSTKKYFIKNPTESVLCSEEDILMTRTGNTGQVVTGVKGAFHNNFFKIKFDTNCDKWFLYYFLTDYKTQHTILKLAGTSTIPDLNHGDFYRLKINFPTLPEQQKIANFLTSVDTKIQQLSTKKELLQQYKKGVMQQLFSQKLRFKPDVIASEEGEKQSANKKNEAQFPDWEEKKLGEVCTVNPKNSKLPDTFVYIDLESVEKGRLILQNEINLEEAPSRAQRMLEINDILFQTVRPYQMNNLYFNENGSYVASTGYAQLRTKEDSMFLFQLLHTHKFVNKVLKRCTGTSYPAINSNDLAKITLSIPSLKEQEKIANYLKAIDTKIENITNQINKTKIFKKGLLQQLFM